MPRIAFALPLALACAAAALAQTDPHSLSALLDGTGFANIPAGEFLMGSLAGNADEQPIRRVRIPRPFQMGRYEVTQAQWDAVMASPHSNKGAHASVNPSKFPGPTRPVESVSWDDVQKFLAALNARDGKHRYRLPTEAEWEYAARAGSPAEAPPALDDSAWYAANSGGETHPAGRKAPNAFGLFDIYGNVQEWVADFYSISYPENDPAYYGPDSGSYKVYRGCAWHSEAKYCRPAYRGFNFPTSAEYSVGFRLVREPR
jgi:formylglycine-generating enzyme required for sulfatase activity